MRKLLFSVLVILILLSGLAGLASANSVSVSSSIPPGHAYIPKGTVLEAELLGSVNSADNDVNDIVYFKIKQNVIIDGVVVLPSGTVGNAYVASVRRAGFLGRQGGIALRVNSVQALNGAIIPLTVDLKKYGQTPNMYLPYLLLGMWDAGYHKLTLCAASIYGEDKEIPAGTKFQVAVDADADLGCTTDNLAVMMIKRSLP